MKTHEVEMPLHQFQELANGQGYQIMQQTERKFEETDIILFIAVDNGDKTGQTYLTQISYVKSDSAALKEGYVLLNLKGIN